MLGVEALAPLGMIVFQITELTLLLPTCNPSIRTGYRQGGAAL